MAHLIDMTNGTASCMTVGEPAWHGLGVNIQEAVTSADAIRLANLDWRVESWPLEAVGPNGERNAAGSAVANVRSDTGAVLGIVSDRYRVFQNAECFDFMDALVGEKLAMYHTAGALDGGKRVWMLAKIPGEYRVAGADTFDGYMLIANSHNGSGSLKVFPTSVRVVCNNTLMLALGTRGSRGMSVGHWPSLSRRVKAARECLGIVNRRLEAAAREARAMVARKLERGEAKAYFEQVLRIGEPVREAPASNGFNALEVILADSQEDAARREAAAELLGGLRERTREERDRKADRDREVLNAVLANYGNDKNNLPGIEGTAWSAYNAVSEYIDHGYQYRGKNDDARANNRLKSVWFGSGSDTKQRAYGAALSLSK